MMCKTINSSRQLSSLLEVVTGIAVLVLFVITPTYAIDWGGVDFSVKYDEPPIPVIIVNPSVSSDFEGDIDGEILVAIYVDENGKVSDAAIMEEGVTSDISAAIFDAVYQNRYEPAKFEGEVVSVWYTISVTIDVAKNGNARNDGAAGLLPKGPQDR